MGRKLNPIVLWFIQFLWSAIIGFLVYGFLFLWVLRIGTYSLSWGVVFWHMFWIVPLICGVIGGFWFDKFLKAIFGENSRN